MSSQELDVNFTVDDITTTEEYQSENKVKSENNVQKLVSIKVADSGEVKVDVNKDLKELSEKLYNYFINNVEVDASMKLVSKTLFELILETIDIVEFPTFVNVYAEMFNQFPNEMITEMIDDILKKEEPVCEGTDSEDVNIDSKKGVKELFEKVSKCTLSHFENSKFEKYVQVYCKLITQILEVITIPTYVNSCAEILNQFPIETLISEIYGKFSNEKKLAVPTKTEFIKFECPIHHTKREQKVQPCHHILQRKLKEKELELKLLKLDIEMLRAKSDMEVARIKYQRLLAPTFGDLLRMTPEELKRNNFIKIPGDDRYKAPTFHKMY